MGREHLYAHCAKKSIKLTSQSHLSPLFLIRGDKDVYIRMAASAQSAALTAVGWNANVIKE